MTIDERPYMESAGDWNYASTVLEFVISVLRQIYPEYFWAIWDEYEIYCYRNNYQIGNASPKLGLMTRAAARLFKQYYLRNPKERIEEFKRKLKNGTILNGWEGRDPENIKSPEILKSIEDA